MSTDTGSLSPDHVLEFVANYVRKWATEQGTRLDGSKLAVALHGEFHDFTYAQIGFENLARLVDEAERRGLLIRHRDVKHLEVSPDPGTPRRPDTPKVSRSSRVPAEVWQAFVFINQGAEYFLDRVTGKVVAGPPAGGAEGDDAARYLKIVPISGDIQREWMREFAGLEGLASGVNEAKEAIEAESWWLTFPRWLRNQSADAEARWRSFRTRKVIEHLKEWAQLNRVDIDLLLVPTQRLPQRDTSQTPAVGAQEDVRKAILTAIADLPIEKLEEIAIPFRYVLRHFEPRR